MKVKNEGVINGRETTVEAMAAAKQEQQKSRSNKNKKERREKRKERKNRIKDSQIKNQKWYYRFEMFHKGRKTTKQTK